MDFIVFVDILKFILTLVQWTNKGKIQQELKLT